MKMVTAVLGLVLFGFVGLSEAGLGPNKASDLVTLRSISSTCPVGGGPLFNTRVLADGTTEAFSVPTGYVLVVTGISWNVVGAVGEDSEVLLRMANGGALVYYATTNVDSLNNGSGSATVPNLVVGPGNGLCIENVSGAPLVLGGVTAHGYLAKDR